MHPTRLSLTFVVALLCGAPAAAAGQSHDPTGGTGLGSPHASEPVNDRSELDSMWPAPTERVVKLFAAATVPSEPRAAGRAPVPPMPQARNRRGVPYMVAGGILFVAGAIAEGDGGTLLMLGGAGIGAYGAFIYFGG